MRKGDLRRAEADGRSVLALSGLIPPELHALAAQAVVSALAMRGAREQAAAELDELGYGGAIPERALASVLLRSRAQLRRAEGRFEEALLDLTDGARRHQDLGWPDGWFEAWSVELAHTHLAAGNVGAARECAYEGLAHAEAMGRAAGLGVAKRALGLVLGGEPGLEALDEAVSILADTEAQLELAQALVDLGAALRRQGRRSDARPRLAEGLDIAQRLGAAVLADTAEAELRVTGARPRRRALTGVDALTASERRIASLAASGSTNREIAQALFLTVKTVEMHLGNAYRKLHITGRAELPGELSSA